MTKTAKRRLLLAVCFFVVFGIFTFLVKTVDVGAVGPVGTEVGFSTFNLFVRDLIGGPRTFFESVANLAGYVLLGVVGGFAFLGAKQLFTRKKLFAVDTDILLLGGLFLLTLASYVFFDKVPVNFRPILEAGETFPEPSFPSSHTVLALVVAVSGISQIRARLKDRPRLQKVLVWELAVTLGVTVICRVLSGVHWATDILGGALLACALLFLYYTACELLVKKK